MILAKKKSFYKSTHTKLEICFVMHNVEHCIKETALHSNLVLLKLNLSETFWFIRKGVSHIFRNILAASKGIQFYRICVQTCKVRISRYYFIVSSAF